MKFKNGMINFINPISNAHIPFLPKGDSCEFKTILFKGIDERGDYDFAAKSLRG